MQAAILANVALIVDGVRSKRAHVNERVKQVTAALTFHDIPATLVQRVVDSIEYYASQHYGAQDREIMEVFPERYLYLALYPVKLVRAGGTAARLGPYEIRSRRTGVCRLRTDIASAVLGEVYPAIGIFLGCSRAMSRQLAERWTMMIAPPNEPVLVTGAQSALRAAPAARKHWEYSSLCLCKHCRLTGDRDVSSGARGVCGKNQ